jgi:hypothetical protein
MLAMGFLNRFFGGTDDSPQPTRRSAPPSDAQAIERYRYLLRTAPPDAIEQAHAEAFAQLTPAQRAQALRELSAELPPSERAQGQGDDDPRTLARMATRAELRQPGTIERTLGARQAGGVLGGGLLSSLAGAFIGSAIAHQLFGGMGEASAGEGDTADHGSSAEAESTDFDESGGGDLGDMGDF